jgi:hypothetical protein
MAQGGAAASLVQRAEITFQEVRTLRRNEDRRGIGAGHGEIGGGPDDAQTLVAYQSVEACKAALGICRKLAGFGLAESFDPSLGRNPVRGGLGDDC